MFLPNSGEPHALPDRLHSHRSSQHDTSCEKKKRLSRSVEGLREAADVVRDRALVAEELDVGTVDTDSASLALLDVLGAVEGSETPLLGDDDLLAAGELVLRAAESLDGDSAVLRMVVSNLRRPMG